MLRNAPHLVQALPFVLPAYKWIDLPFYGIGLKIYDLLSGKSTMGPTSILSKKETVERLPNIATKDLCGSIMYHDGQFDDARLALALARTAQKTTAQSSSTTSVQNPSSKPAAGLLAQSFRTAIPAETRAPKSQSMRKKLSSTPPASSPTIFASQDDPAIPKLLSVSRGTHIVVAESVLAGHTAIMVPKTPDGRVIFAIPWSGRVVIGTTDLAATTVEMEPGHQKSEIEYLMETINPYLATPIRRSDILSVFSGLRPLVTGKSATTSKLSREHHIDTSPSGLITVAGGKWTTYRRMAEDVPQPSPSRTTCSPPKPCQTDTVKIHGAPAIRSTPASGPLFRYGTDAAEIEPACEQSDPSPRRHHRFRPSHSPLPRSSTPSATRWPAPLKTSSPAACAPSSSTPKPRNAPPPTVASAHGERALRLTRNGRSNKSPPSSTSPPPSTFRDHQRGNSAS